MLEAQPDDVVAATLWELEETVSAAVPGSALTTGGRSPCGGYDVLVKWPSPGPHGNPSLCSLSLHLTASDARVYCGMNHPKREEVRRRVNEWLSAQLEAHIAAQCMDTGFDLRCVAPASCFYDDAEAIRVTEQDQMRDFAVYRGAPAPRLT